MHWSDDILDRRSIAWFLLIAFGLAWLLDLTIWLNGGLAKAHGLLFGLLTLLRNFTPAIAVFVVTHWISPLPSVRLKTGLRWGKKGSRWGLYWLFALLLVPFMFYVASPFIANLMGVAPLDLVNFSGYRNVWKSIPGGSTLLAGISIQSLAFIALGTLPIFALFISPLSFGEEWGWRGYLLTQLLPLGQWRALIITGLIWGLWHFPLYTGAEFPKLNPLLALILFALFTTIWGIVLGWMRLATDSLWPAVLGHAGIDSGQSLAVLAVFSKAGTAYNAALASPVGLAGLIAPLVAIFILVITRQLPVQGKQPRDLKPS